MIKVAFYKANSVNKNYVDTLINIVTGSVGYSHVEIFDPRYNEYFSISGREDISRHKYIDETNGNWTIVEIDNIDITNFEIIDILENKKYDYWNILVFMLPFLYIDIKDRIICSSTVTEILKFNGLIEVALYPSFRISPNKLFTILERRKDVRIRYY